MKRTSVAIALLVFLLVVSNALAMSSPNYRVDWFTPGTSGGGGEMSSAHYRANVTVGQTAIGHSDSTNYAAGLGFWFGWPDALTVYLPFIRK